MKPVRKNIPIQMVPLVTVRRKAFSIPAALSCTAPICVMPRLSIRSPVLAHTTIARIMTSVLIRKRFSLHIMRIGLVVAGSSRASWNENFRFGQIAASFDPLGAFSTEFEKSGGFFVKALALVAVPQRFFHDAPYDFRAEIVVVVEAVDTIHHFRFRQMRIFNVWQL